MKNIHLSLKDDLENVLEYFHNAHNSPNGSNRRHAMFDVEDNVVIIFSTDAQLGIP